jgi:hypothetical protein
MSVEHHVEGARVTAVLGHPDVLLNETVIGATVGVAVFVVGAEERQRSVLTDPPVLARHEGVEEAGDDLLLLVVLVSDGRPLDIGAGQELIGLAR